MQLNGVASSILVVWFVILSLVVLGVLGGMAFVLWKVNAKIDQLTPKVEPLLDKVDQALTAANDRLSAIGDRTEHIVAQGEEVAVNVHNKVDRTATAVQRTVHAPIIMLNALAAGVSHGFGMFTNLQQKRSKWQQEFVGVKRMNNGVRRSSSSHVVNNGRSVAEHVTASTGKEPVNGRH